MQHFKKKIGTFDETVIENSFGKRIILSEFHVPKGYNVTDFSLSVSVRDAYSSPTILPVSILKTRDSHIADLTLTPDILVPASKLMTVKVTKPAALRECKLKMAFIYQHY